MSSKANKLIDDTTHSMRIYKSIKISEADVYKLTTEILKDFQISTKYIGYDLIVECVNTILQYEGDDVVYYTYVYPAVASIYHKTPENVEKSIRLAINNAKSIHPELFENRVFGNGKLSNVVFINFLVGAVRRKYLLESKSNII